MSRRFPLFLQCQKDIYKLAQRWRAPQRGCGTRSRNRLPVRPLVQIKGSRSLERERFSDADVHRCSYCPSQLQLSVLSLNYTIPWLVDADISLVHYRLYGWGGEFTVTVKLSQKTNHFNFCDLVFLQK